MTTVAIMQPYFFPYAGYYRLLALADIFVILDCVQFPRRGWVHRNKLTKQDGSQDWLTLPIKKPAYHDLISSLEFTEDTHDRFYHLANSFPHLHKILKQDNELASTLLNFQGSVVDYLERTLQYTSNLLDYSPKICRSSQLNIPKEIKGQKRIEAIAQELQASRYINLEGGVEYYTSEGFQQRGISLGIFTPFHGSKASMIERLITQEIKQIKQEINQHLSFIVLPK
ncbi:MAG: WbqC family protein [Halopseudomonas aestusnigri]